MKVTELSETELEQNRVEFLNSQLQGWADIYNGLRGNADFGHRATFLWMHVLEPVYKQKMPRDAQFSLEVTENTFERLRSAYPQNVEKIDDGRTIKFYLNVDPPLAVPAGDSQNTGRLEIYQSGGPEHFRFGLLQHGGAGASTQGNVLQQTEIIGFQIRPKTA